MKSACYFCGCAKDCAVFIPKVFENIHKLGKVFDEYSICIYLDTTEIKNDPTHRTLIIEKINANKRGIKMEIIKNNGNISYVRTQNIAKGRNLLVEYVERENVTNNWKYFIMIDMDDVNSINVNPEVLKKYISSQPEDKSEWGWDALSFNRTDYYDLWALSIQPFVYSIWHWRPNPRVIIPLLRNYIIQKLNDLKSKDTNELLPCISAFNGCAIYKCDTFKGIRYNWHIKSTIFPREMLDLQSSVCNTQLITDYSPNPTVNDSDCEHRSFHYSAIKNRNAKIMISPLCLFE
jgi:hypothetical protein